MVPNMNTLKGGRGEGQAVRDGHDAYLGQVLHAQARRAAAQAGHQSPRESRDTRRQQRHRRRCRGNQARKLGCAENGKMLMLVLITVHVCF